MNRESIETTIRQAIYVKNRLDHGEYPVGARDPLGRNIVIPDDERSAEDILEEKEKNLAMSNPEIVNVVFGLWFRILDDREREIVKLRCRPMGWKKVSRKAEEIGIIDRQYSYKQLRRIFSGALDKIIARFFR